MKIGIVGASGFVGARAVEYLTLSGLADVRAIVRRHGGLARLSRFEGIDWRLAEATNEEQLFRAFEGCDCVLHSIMGDDREVAICAAPAYRAAERAGVERIVFLSSAAVYGNLQLPEVDEATPLPGNPTPYAKAKIRAERKFLELGSRGRVGVVILRPSIIIGPRSNWISGPAQQLLSSRAWLAGGGAGYCNTVYVDNLIDSALLACSAEKAAGEIFLIADDEAITWGEYYRRLGKLLGITSSSIRNVPRPSGGRRLTDRVRKTNLFKAGVLLAPSSVRQAVKKMIGEGTRTSRWSFAEEESFPQHLAALHCTPWRLRTDKAHRLLGYRPRVSVDEALKRSVLWLRFAGWKVQDQMI